MISRDSILHRPKSNFAYGYDEETLHIRIRTKIGDVDKVTLRIGDPYIWTKGGADGGNLEASDGSGWSGVNVEMTKEVTTEYHDYWFASFKPSHKRSRYAFILESSEERLLVGERRMITLTKDNTWVLSDLSNFFCFPYLNKKDVHTIPDWVKDTVWYQIFPDRFENGDKSIDPKGVEPWGSRPKHHNFNGGDLQGIINRLDYLKDMGFNGIYLCPIFEARTNHRYDTVDYMTIDKGLGDKAKFKELVEKAHEKGIKIMLDAVFNHMGSESPIWLDVVKNNEKSKYSDWFHINKFPVYDKPYDELDGRYLNYETFGRVKSMPKVNTENPEVIEYFMEVGKYWIEEFNIDAWRIDVANEVDHHFWRRFRDEVKSVKEDVFLLGEVWHDAGAWLQGDQFDAVMNYPLTDAMKQYFCTRTINKSEFIHAVNQVKVSYSLQVTEHNFNLLDSHDTSRLLTTASQDIDRIKLSYFFMMTQLGSPCVYYGSEIPMTGKHGGGLEDHRKCMTFDHIGSDMHTFMTDIIKMRHEHEEFKLYDNKWLDHDSLLIFKKGDLHVVINPTQEKQTLELDKSYLSYFDKNQVKDSMTIPPMGYCLLK
ncbi:alpha-glycosidase [Acidaminobacter sp. JC074]|uniref:glycoside hydrolase family 13 protein n=1 Tax=Acidaminobacter sp. JC074 TaxID=2530199 RepID=UPI001F0ED193|nr:glycoside hydrolase family 13 protein [Acidaminobacter sp. JC074]MCH4885954.1 alpha-glycosidase [Acidaminobacter sp. JC074]